MRRSGHYWIKLKSELHLNKWRIAEVSYTDDRIGSNQAIETIGRGSLPDPEEHEIAEWGPFITPPPALEIRSEDWPEMGRA